MKIFLCLLLCLSAIVLEAKDFFRSAPDGIYFPLPPSVEEVEIIEEPPVAEVAEEKAPEIKDLSLSGNAEGLQDEALKRELKPFYLNQTLSMPQIEVIKEAIVRYFQNLNKPFVRVEVPPQEVTKGVLRLVVTEGKLGKIIPTGNRWFTDKQLLSYIHLKPNAPIDEERLILDLNEMNRNPFRRTDAIYEPGELPGTTDIELLTKDRFPVRVYVGSENSGLKQTGIMRWFAGLNWGNVFGLDHLLSYQYTTSSDFYKFQAHTFNYTTPSGLSFFGGYSSVHARLPIHHRHTDGWSLQCSTRYNVALNPGKSLLQELYFGGDFKRTNNSLEFVEERPLFGKNTNLTQLIAGYVAGIKGKRLQTNFDLEIACSPDGWLPDQTNADYQTLRPFAKVSYAYAKAALSGLYQLPKSYALFLLLRGQYASANLLPSEEFGIGGYNTVRGYEERDFNGDNAFLARGEIHSPFFHFLRSKKDSLQLLGFLDYGITHDHKLLKKEQYSYYLLGVGPGLRYLIAPYLSVRLDWGIKLHKISFDESWSRLHFGVIASY